MRNLPTSMCGSVLVLRASGSDRLYHAAVMLAIHSLFETRPEG
jgi:hypothetical protein